MVRDIYHFLNPTHLRELFIGTRAWEEYWSKTMSNLSPYHKHREHLVDTIMKYNPQSVLEIGCDMGQNLRLIAQRNPEIKCVGIDINKESISEGNKLLNLQVKLSSIKLQRKLKSINHANVILQYGKADELEGFEDKSFDVVFTDAVLMYIGQDKINNVLGNMKRVASQAIVLCEWDYDDCMFWSRYYRGGWLRNYTAYFNMEISPYVPLNNIRKIKITHEMWPDKIWSKYGAIIEVKI